MTNKTVSRWENANIEMLSLLSREFDVSLNELVEGQRLDEEGFQAADKNLATVLERPMDKLRRWLERYGMFAFVVVLLCIFIAGITAKHTQYYQAHPLDAQTPCTFGSHLENPIDVLYRTFSHDGRYYIFTPGGEYLEVGDYARDRDVITMDNGESARWVVVEGYTIRDIDPGEGGLLTYEFIDGIPFFIGEEPSHNVAP